MTRWPWFAKPEQAGLRRWGAVTGRDSAAASPACAPTLLECMPEQAVSAVTGQLMRSGLVRHRIHARAYGAAARVGPRLALRRLARPVRVCAPLAVLERAFPSRCASSAAMIRARAVCCRCGAGGVASVGGALLRGLV